MKKLLTIAFIGVVVLALTACGSEDDTFRGHSTGWGGSGSLSPVRKAKNKVFLSGTYVLHDSSRYVKVTDSLFIRKRRNTGSLYDVTRKTRFNCELEESPAGTINKSKQWLGSFDDRSNVLYLIGSEIRLQIQPTQNTLLLAGSPFQKVE